MSRYVAAATCGRHPALLQHTEAGASSPDGYLLEMGCWPNASLIDSFLHRSSPGLLPRSVQKEPSSTIYSVVLKRKGHNLLTVKTDINISAYIRSNCRAHKQPETNF